MTWPNISYVVHILSQFMHGPKQSHMDVAMKLINNVLKPGPARPVEPVEPGPG